LFFNETNLSITLYKLATFNVYASDLIF